MTTQNYHEAQPRTDNDESYRSSTNYMREKLIYIVILAIILCIIFNNISPSLLRYIESLNVKYNKQETPSIQSEDYYMHNNNAMNPIAQTALNNENLEHADDTIPSANQELDALSHNNAMFDAEDNPYNRDIEKEYNTLKIELMHSFMHKMSNYRLYLENGHKLLDSFKMNIEYEVELNKFDSIPAPRYIMRLSYLLRRYNDCLMYQDISEEKIKILNAEFLNKFIKITKHTPVPNDCQELKKEISNNLHLLIEFLYSKELQAKFINLNHYHNY